MLLAFTVSLIVMLVLLLMALSRDGDEVSPSSKDNDAERVCVLNVNGPLLFVVPSDRRAPHASLQIDHDLTERPRTLKAIAGGRRGARGQPAAVLAVVEEYQRED